jgi:hypothetical protein
MLALTSPTNGGRSGGIVRLRTKATDFFNNNNNNNNNVSSLFLNLIAYTLTFEYISMFPRQL